MTDTLLLGPVSFQGFEVPGRIGFGGGQRLAVHVLPGGARVIDAMGRDDADIAWHGAFSGVDAADRARMLDALRANGDVLPLAWDAFAYLVVISTFQASYERSNFVPYRISCVVVADRAQSPVETAISLSTTLTSDLAVAGLDGPSATAALAAVALAGAISPGTPEYASALGAVGALSAQIDVGMGSYGTALLAASDPATAAAAAGSLAQYADANGYVGRTLSNLTNLEI